MMMKSVFWWRKPEHPEETTDLRQVTDETFSHIRPLPSPGIELGPQRCEAKGGSNRVEKLTKAVGMAVISICPYVWTWTSVGHTLVGVAGRGMKCQPEIKLDQLID